MGSDPGGYGLAGGDESSDTRRCGFGKTIVAALALLQTAKNGYQGCIMAPTEVLARQHYETFQKLLEPFGVTTVLLTGSMGARERRASYEAIAGHGADIIVGTHALIQEGGKL